MNFVAARQEVYNRGKAPIVFLQEMVAWAKKAPTSLFERNEFADIYARVKEELGPYEDIANDGGFALYIYRIAVLLEVLRVLALFESGAKHSEGVDASKSEANTNENAESGAFQESYNIRKLSSDIQTVLLNANITNGVQFQAAMKRDHELSFLITAMALRLDMSNFNKIPNGPLRKGDERRKTWPDRPKLWKAEESIYPHLSRAAVAEFQLALTEAE